MPSFKNRYLVEIISCVLLIVILIYLPGSVKMILKNIFSPLSTSYHLKVDNCSDIKIIKHFYPLKGEIWIILDTPCLTLNTGDLLIYKNQLLGKVIDKSGEYNIILPLYNKDMKLRVKIETKDGKIIEGVYKGTDKNSGMIFYIPAQFEIVNGTTVYTLLDKQNKIPENLVVGTIREQIIEPNQTVILLVNTNINLDTLPIIYVNK